MKLEAFFAPLCTLCKFDRITIAIEMHEVNVQAHRRENKEGSDFQKGFGISLHAAVTSFPKCRIRRGFDLRCLTYAGTRTEEERGTERRCFLEEAQKETKDTKSFAERN